MLSKKVQGSGMLTVATCIDRGRVGERLQAALAGLQELHFLKEKQADMVHWALRMDRETTDACQSNTTPVYAEEQRLEATLCALKQQLTRLRRQDMGLKTHLQQLDQQISELKLDVCKASTEHLESDSRPSSGFYELSDGGSGSLSNSCTSVYSACLSSSSQSNLQAFAVPAPLVIDDSRRRSADETAAHPDPPRGSGIRLGSSRIRTGMPSVERGRQRPVSTGDLERLLTPGVGYLRPSEVRTSSLSNNMRTNAHVDMKYQNNLVSRGGTEVYLYPSPLHAVALQSPIFYLGSCPSASLPSENRDPQEGTVASGSAGAARPESAQARPVGYISKLLQRSTSRLNVLVENAAPPMGPVSTCTPHALTTGAQDSERNQTAKIQTPIFFEESTILSNNHLDGNKDSRMDFKHSVGNCGSLGRSVSCSTEKPNQIRHSDPQTSGPSKMASKAEMAGGSLAMANLCERSGQETRKRSSSKPPERRPKVSTASEESNAVPSEFVHAQFVPAGSQHVKFREQADRKTKAVRLRRRSCDKQRGSKQLQKLSARDREREATAKLRLERNSKALARHSASEFSVHGHPPLCCPGGAATKCDKTFTFYQPSSEHLHPEQYGGKRRQHHPQKQPSSSASEVRLTQSASYTQRPRDVPVQGSGRRSGTRPQSGHWGGAVAAATRPVLRPSVSTTSYFSQMDVRYPPAPHRRHALPKCESELSEYSAECASLFHSTVAGSSEGELSDYTTNRFGDSESSQGSQSHYDSDSSLSLYEDQLDGGEGEDEGDEGGLVWPEAALGPTAAGLPLSQASRSQPLACRIKASRALKKKIRRFQPASLKVMTLV